MSLQDIKPLLTGKPNLDLPEQDKTFKRVDDNFRAQATDITTANTNISALQLKIIAPHYDSGWYAIAADETKTFTHNLGGNTDKYIIDMQFKDTGALGINAGNWGGAGFGAGTYGMYWRELSTTIIKVVKLTNDANEYVRIRIWLHA